MVVFCTLVSLEGALGVIVVPLDLFLILVDPGAGKVGTIGVSIIVGRGKGMGSTWIVLWILGAECGVATLGSVGV